MDRQDLQLPLDGAAGAMGRQTSPGRTAPVPEGSPVFVRGVGPGRVVRSRSEGRIEVSSPGGGNTCIDEQDMVEPTRHLDYLNPAANDPSRRVSSASAVFSLLSTMVGGGVLSLPFAFQQSGIVFSVVATCLSGMASGMTIDMLIGASRATGAGSYEQVAQRAFGRRGRIATSSLMVGLIWLCQIAYLVLLADLMVPVLAALPIPLHMETKGIRAGVICSAVTLISPLCFKTSLHALRFMSYVAFTALLIVVVSLARFAFETLGQDHQVHVFSGGKEVPVYVGADTMNLWPVSLGSVLYVFPIFGLSFLCHFNVLPMHSELVAPSRGRTKRVIFNAMFACNIMYLIAGWCGMVYAGQFTCGNILLNFSAHELMINVARVALSLTLCGTFPLFILPCRANLHQLLSCPGESPEASAPPDPLARETSLQTPQATSDSVDADLAEVAAASPEPDAPPVAGSRVSVYDRFSRRERTSSDLVKIGSFEATDGAGQAMTWTTTAFVTETLVLMISSVFFACVLDSVLVVWTIAGATVSFAVAFTFPTLMWIRLHSHQAPAWKVLIAKALCGLSVVLSIACTYEVVVNLNHTTCPAPA